MNDVLSRLWLSFWRLLPANPILVRVVQGASKRPRHLWLRLAYLVALLLVVMLGMIVPALGGQSASLTDLAKGASNTFKIAAWVQLLMMCLLAPTFTAAAITQERDAQTFNILLSTPLSNAQIVFGSLMSRLYFVIMLLVAGLPIFLITMVYGGVTQRQVFESFALSGGTAVLTGALAIFIAMVRVGTRKTIFSFYFAIVLYLLLVYALGQWPRTWIDVAPESVDGKRMSWLAALHPFLSLEVALNRIQAPPFGYLTEKRSIVRYALAYPSATYVMWTTLLAFLLTATSVLFARRSAVIGEATWLTRLAALFGRRKTSDRTRQPHSVWHNPVAWREAKTRVAGGAAVRWSIILGGITAFVIVLIYYLQEALSVADVRQWLAGLFAVQFALALILATNMAATSMTKEKEAKTMDILLTTPLSSKYMLWGKLRGLVSAATPMIVGPVLALLVVAGFGLRRDNNPPAVWLEVALLIALLTTIYTAVACVIGLRVSLFTRKNATAVMYSVGIMVILCGMASLVGFPLVESAGGEFGAFLAPFTPFTAIKCMIDVGFLFETTEDLESGASTARWASLIGSGIAIVVYAFIVWTIYTGLVKNFDQIVRKQSGT